MYLSIAIIFISNISLIILLLKGKRFVKEEIEKFSIDERNIYINRRYSIYAFKAFIVFVNDRDLENKVKQFDYIKKIVKYKKMVTICLVFGGILFLISSFYGR